MLVSSTTHVSVCPVSIRLARGQTAPPLDPNTVGQNFALVFAGIAQRPDRPANPPGAAPDPARAAARAAHNGAGSAPQLQWAY